MGTNETLLSRLRRGHLISRLGGRVTREAQHIMTTVVLTLSKPTPGRVTIVTLNADEENATVQVVLLGDDTSVYRVSFLSPDPDVSKVAVALAETQLDRSAPASTVYLRLGYWEMLRQYRMSETTYSTHVLLPGRDFSKRRRHVHLTHGSGPKPDTTFRGPTNVLASITPQWVPAQLREYKLPPDTEVIDYMPRLEVMRRAVGDRTVQERLGLDPTRKLVVWAPTYRAVRRENGEVRVSGIPFDQQSDEVDQTATGRLKPLTISSFVEESHARGWNLVAKIHPHDAGTYENLNIPVHTSASLRNIGITPYQLFGSAALLVTDYSSIYVERAELDLDYAFWRPDIDEFAASYRGLRRQWLDTDSGDSSISNYIDLPEIYNPDDLKA